MSVTLHVALGDIDEWVTGRCWLYCRRENVRVLRIGPVRTPALSGDLYACARCITELTHLMREMQRAKDRPAVAVRGCEHRELVKKRDGKTYCRGCERQIYL